MSVAYSLPLVLCTVAISGTYSWRLGKISGRDRAFTLRGGAGRSGEISGARDAESAVPKELPADEVEPIDFSAALQAAHAQIRSGGSRESAIAAAANVISGQLRPAVPTSILDMAVYEDWLSESNARLLQHEAVTAPGWAVTPAHRHLALQAPLPAWAADVAQQLEPIFDGVAPTWCHLFACEPGQIAGPLHLHDSEFDHNCCTLLVLHGSGTLVCENVQGDKTTCTVVPRNLLQFGPDAHRTSVYYKLEADERLIALLFRRGRAGRRWFPW